jgi:AcrR family transcriptional regulator
LSSSAEKNNYHHGDLKSSLIAAANTILQRNGADALSLRAIAAEVGVSHMAPYSHFKNKKELLQGVAAEGFQQMAELMEADKQDTKDAGQQILSYGAAYLKFATQNPQLYRLMLGQVETTGRKHRSNETDSDDSQPQISLELSVMSKRPYQLLKDAFAMYNDNHDEVKLQALGAWSMVHGMAALLIEGHIQVPEGMSLRHFLGMSVAQREKLAPR